MSLTKKIAFNTFAQIVGKVLTTILSLYLVGILTRYLGVAGYGKYTTIFSYFGFFAILADFGFFWILVRDSANQPELESKTVSNIFTLRTIFAIFVYLVGFVISLFISNYSGLASGMAIGALMFFLVSLNSTLIGVFQAHLRMDKPAASDVAGKLIVLIIASYLVRINAGLNHILFAYFIGNLLNLFINFYLVKAYTKVNFQFDKDHWKYLLRESLPMAMITIFTFIYFKIDVLILSLVKSSYDVGIYGPSYKILEILITLPAMFLGNIFPEFSRLVHKDSERLKRIFQKTFDFMLIAALPLTVGGVIFASKLIEIIGGQEYLTASSVTLFGHPATAVTTLQILSFCLMFCFVTGIFGNLLISSRNQKNLVIPYIVFALFNIGANIYFIPRYSYIGAAFTTFLTEILVFVVMAIMVKKYIGFYPNLKILWQLLLAAVAMIIVCLLLINLNIYLAAFLGVLAYLAVVLLFGLIPKNIIAELVRKK